MTELPVDTITAAEVFEWYRVTEELKEIKQREHFLRMRVFRHLVPVPVEGVNSVDLASHAVFNGVDTLGYVLKAQYVISREVDEAALTVLLPKLREAKVPVEELIKRKPTLAVGAYRKLTKEETQLFDQALVIKPGSPQLEIMLPKKRA